MEGILEGQNITVDFNEQEVEEILSHQNFLMAIMGGFLSSITSAVLWAFITVTSGFQIGYMAIAIGFFVGYCVRFFGNGITKTYRIIGAFFALAACLGGNLLSILGFISKSESINIFYIINKIDPSYLLQAFQNSIQPIDFLFYAFAIYEGYRFSICTPKDLHETLLKEQTNEKSVFDNKTLISGVWSALLILVFFTSSIISSNGEKFFYYETGEVSARGFMKSGKLQGEWNYFSIEGNKKSTLNYNKGIIDGKCQWWDEKGELIKTGFYEKGMLNGNWTFYENNKKIGESNFVNERRHGIEISWYSNGQLKEKSFYKRDRQDSITTLWYENGTISNQGYYKSGKKQGEWKTWDSTGKLIEDITFINDTLFFKNYWDKDGKQIIINGNGVYKSYYENGQLSTSGEVKNGQRYGKWINWYENGQKSTISIYKDNDVLVKQTWDRNGKVQVVDGNGEFLSFYDNGKLYAKGMYKDGKAVGIWEYFYENGSKFQVSEFTNGIEDGAFKTFFETGQVSSEGKMKNGKQFSDWIWYNENGTISSKAVFNDHGKDGVQEFFNEDGVHIKNEFYKDSKFIKEKTMINS